MQQVALRVTGLAIGHPGLLHHPLGRLDPFAHVDTQHDDLVADVLVKSFECGHLLQAGRADDEAQKLRTIGRPAKSPSEPGPPSRYSKTVSGAGWPFSTAPSTEART